MKTIAAPKDTMGSLEIARRSERMRDDLVSITIMVEGKYQVQAVVSYHNLTLALMGGKDVECEITRIPG